jgi:hypothetical protein
LRPVGYLRSKVPRTTPGGAKACPARTVNCPFIRCMINPLLSDSCQHADDNPHHLAACLFRLDSCEIMESKAVTLRLGRC